VCVSVCVLLVFMLFVCGVFEWCGCVFCVRGWVFVCFVRVVVVRCVFSRRLWCVCVCVCVVCMCVVCVCVCLVVYVICVCEFVCVWL